MTLISRCITLAVALAASAGAAQAQTQEAPPSAMLGKFLDDYGNPYEITREEWRQGPKAIYHIIKWNAREQYIVAHNAPENSSNPNRFSRIDLVRFQDQGEWTWGYCYTAYKAETPEAAEATAAADRGNPKKGCKGFPFSRMKSAM